MYAERSSNRVGRGLPDFDVNESDTNVTEGITTPSGQAAVEAEVMEAMMEADECCYICGKSPCEWIEFGLPAISELKNRFCIDTAKSHGYIVDISNGEHVPNKNVRFSCYRLFTYEKYGHLGHGNRMKLPDCVEAVIKETFPDLDGMYTNFQAGDSVNDDV